VNIALDHARRKEPHVTMLNLQVLGTGEKLPFAPHRLFVAGYAGRDLQAVEAHIAELASIGVPRPATIPAFYQLAPELLTTDATVSVTGPATSGEVEPVILRRDGDYYLTVGSDHTDRDLERSSIDDSKAACPKPIAPTAVRLGTDLASTSWEEMTVASTVDGDPYQAGAVSTLRHPADLFERLAGAIGQVTGDFALFCGTVPLLEPEFVFGTAWTVRLGLPDGCELTHGYEVWVDAEPVSV